MTLRRYANTKVLGIGKQYGTSEMTVLIRNAVNNGSIRAQKYITKQDERLDIIAGQSYNDGTLWWIIASCSNIGWGLQVPAGTRLLIPNLEDIATLIG